MKRLNDPSRRVVIAQRHRFMMKLRFRIEIRPRALRHRDAAEMFAISPVLMHMAARDERVMSIDAKLPVRGIEAAAESVRRGRAATGLPSFPRLGWLEWRVGKYASDRICHAGCDRLRS